MPIKRALLIGVDTYPHVPPLNGCVNDANLMRSVLVDTFGFAADHISLLVNEQATRAGILSAFDALVSATAPDDIVVFHYSGHGSQIADREGDEPSGFDSTIVPFDATRPVGDAPDITDDEIHLRLEALAEKTSFITLIFDSCHSGTITRDDFGEPGRSIAADTRPASELPPSPIPADRRPAMRAAGASGWMPLADQYVLIAGCRDEERSYEYRPPEGGGAVVHGAMTYFLCQQLRRASTNNGGNTTATSYRDVFERTAALVNAVNTVQHPQMEGRIDRVVFNVTDLAPATYVRILERDGDAVLLAAGAAHGVTLGSTYGVFPQGTRDPRASGSTAIGELEITGVQSVTALARIRREAPAGAIVPDARAFEQAHAFHDPRLTVAFAPTDDVDGKVAALRTRLAASKLVAIALAVGEAPVQRQAQTQAQTQELTPAQPQTQPQAQAPPSAPTQPPAQASVCVYRLAARAALSPSSPVPQAGVLAEDRWAVVGATGDLLMPLQPFDDADTLVDNLERIAKYRQALAIDNPDPLSRLRGHFTVALQMLGEDRKTWTEAAPAPGSGLIVFDEGAIVRVVIRSTHDAPVFVSLYDFGVSAAIGQIYPARGAQEMLRAHGELMCQAQRLGLPAVYPLAGLAGTAPSGSPPSDPTRSVEGLETVKLFVTEQATDFSAFAQDSVRDDAAPSPLATLLSSAFNGRTTRDMSPVPVAVGDEDWTTASISFVLRRPAKEV
jgi:hypothetical protein